MSQLPKGWVGCKLGDVVDYGKTVKAVMTNIDNDAWVLELEDLEKDSSKILQRVSFGERKPKSAKNAFKAGDVLYGKLRPYLNKMVIAPEDGICTSEIIPLKVPTGLVDNRFLFYWLKGRVFGDYVNAVSYGVNMPRLGTKDGSNAPMVLAPTTEQKRIVAKLDEVLAQVDTIKARLDRIPAILKRFRQSVLAAAVSGKLTEEWRGSSILVGWQMKKLGSIVQAIEAGKNLKCIETPPENDEYGIIKISAVTWGVYDEEQSKTLPSKDLFIESRRVNVGDFLISRANTIELLGNPVIVHRVTKNLMLSDKVLRLVMREEDKSWVSIFLRSTDGRKEIESRSTGNQMSMRNIGQKALLDIDVPKAPDREQTEIVRLVDQYFAFADTIEAQVKKAQARVDNLTQSLLAKAFRGELVAQDPNDEPADKLLARIAQARIEAEALAKTSKKVGRKGKATS